MYSTISATDTARCVCQHRAAAQNGRNGTASSVPSTAGRRPKAFAPK